MAINNIEQVKWIVHKILPAVYDEALSYYEVLCKVIAKLNEVIANEDAQNEMLVGFDERLSDVEEAVSEIESDIRGEITDVLKTYNGYANGKFLGVSGDEIKWVNMPTVITSYDSLTDKPQINGVTLAGNKTSAQLNIKQIPAGGVVGQVLKKLSDNDYDVAWGSSGGGGGGGTTDYTDLDNKPQINGVTLAGNKSTADLSLGDMKKADYDSDSAVDDAGGIAAYVGSAISAGTSGLMGEADYDTYEVVKDAGGIVPYVESKVVASVVQNFPEDSDFVVVMNNADDGVVASTVIKGKTVAINQLVPTAEKDFTNSATDTRTPPRFGLRLKESPYTSFFSEIISSTGLFEKITTATASGLSQFIHSGAENNIIYVNNLPVINSHIYFVSANFTSIDITTVNGLVVKDIQLIDLSIIFTATELTAIGTDVSKLKTAWLAKFGYPLPLYIPYDAGSLANVNGKYRVRGRNLWDEETRLGTYLSTDGSYVSAGYDDRLCNTNSIKVNPNTTYYFKTKSGLTAGNIYYYDANKDFISVDNNKGNGTFTTPSTCSFINLSFGTAYGTTYEHDICINLSNSSFNGTYEAYYDGGEIDCSDAPLNGVGTVQDEKDFTTGKRTNKCDTANLGEVEWHYNGDGVFWASITGVYNRTGGANLAVCGRYASSEEWTATNMPDKSFMIRGDLERVYIKDTAYSDTTTFTAAMNNVDLVYAIATPVTTTETAQPIYTKNGYNVLEPISGDVQSADVNATYLHMLGDLFSVKADLINGKVPDSQLPDFGEANVINFDSIVSGTTTIPSDDRTKLSDMTKPCEIHIGTAVYHRATPFRFYWEQKGTVLNVVKILEINSSTYIITETTMFASYATTSTNKGIPETGTNGVWKLVANKTVASDSANTGFTYTELLGGNYDEYMIVVKGKAKGNVSILNTNSGGTSLSNTITYREGASTTISNNQSTIPATNGNYFEATLTLKNYISFGSGNGGYFALEGNVCDGDSTTQSTYFIQCAWKIAYAGTYNIGFNNLAKDTEIRLYGRNTGDYDFPNPL